MSYLTDVWDRFGRLLHDGRDGEKDHILLLARLSIVLFVLVLPFQHNALWKNLAMVGMLFASVTLFRQCRLDRIWRSPVWWIFGGLFSVLCLTAAIGSDPLDSFRELRKHFLPGFFLLVLVPVVFAKEDLIRLLLAICASVFVLRAGLALLELARYLPDLNAGRTEGHFIKGFALDAGFYIPILLGLLLLGGKLRWLALCGLPMILVVMLLVQSRTPIFAAFIAATIMLASLRQWKTLALGFISVLLVAGYVVVTQPEIGKRLASTLNIQTYRTAFDVANFSQPQDGLTARTAIWMGLLEITAPRWWQGYGFGWKKLGKTAVDSGYVAKWQARQGDTLAQEQAWYFALPSDKVNPHSLYLQIYFESGLLGVLAYLFAVGALLWMAIRTTWCDRAEVKIVGAIMLSYLVDHLILGFANGLWIGLGPSFVLIALLETVHRCEITQ